MNTWFLRHRSWLNWGGILLLLLLVGFLPKSLQMGRLVNLALIYAIVVIGYDFAFGHTGMVSFAQVSFFALGAYTSAIVNMDLGWPIWASALAGLVVCAVIALGMGKLLLRLRGHYLAIGTLAFAQVVEVLLGELHGITRGQTGIVGIPRPNFFGIELAKSSASYWLIAAIFLVMLYIGHKLLRSGAGRLFHSVRDAEVAASAMGVPVAQVKLVAFALSGIFGAVGGSLFAHTSGYVSPDQFALPTVIALLAMLLIGGRSSLPGALMGSVFVTFLPEMVRFSQKWYMVVYAVGLLVVIIFAPGGLSEFVNAIAVSTNRRWNWIFEKLPSPSRRPNAVQSQNYSKQSAPLLEVRDLTISFGGIAALAGFTHMQWPGEIVGLIGPNGAGKTTVLNLLTGVHRPMSGSIHVAGKPVSGLEPYEIARAGVTRTFQNIRLYSSMTVLENVMVGVELRDAKGGVRPLISRLFTNAGNELSSKQRALELIEAAGLTREDAMLQASQLPYGKQRLVEIARALATEPRLLLLDEPAAGLTPTELVELGKRLIALRDRGIGILLVEHNMRLVLDTCDRVVVLSFGKEIASGKPRETTALPAVVEAYMGRRKWA